ncbi:hypothetical protein [Moraxella cuniculi]|uniref:Uncharacterized protein n=1 Tax=Moraxella cuniculi TaxID=34061 RepID=A0A3S4SYM5_9GAMM|nr:hypothetical protein [Moraxella cuniculi]VEG12773.1 Uncharacterised protein [Moraxella cuniculi]
MSFWNSLLKAAGTAMSAAGDIYNATLIETWNAYKRKNQDTLGRIIEAHETTSQKRAIAIAACHRNGYMLTEVFLDHYYANTEGGKYDNKPLVKESLSSLIKKIAEVDGDDAQELIDALQGALRRYF